MSLRTGRLAPAATLAFLCVCLTGGTALAEPQPYDPPPPPVVAGNVGTYALTDTEANNGARCIFGNIDVDQHLVAIRVRKPTAYAIDRTSGPDKRMLGWRFYVEEWQPGSSSWSVVFKTDVQRASATDTHAAGFGSRIYRLGFTPTSWYRIRVRVLWYKLDGTQDGHVDVWVDWYRNDTPFSDYSVEDPCYYFFT